MAGLLCVPTVGEGQVTCEDGHPQRCTCCENVTTVFKRWLSPNEPCSFMRMLLQFIFASDFYQKYFRHCKYSRIVNIIALVGAAIYGYSFSEGSWKCELEECIGGICTEGYRSLLLFLYTRGVVLNVNGLIFSLGLFYGVLTDKPDFIYLWLLWKEIVIMIGFFTVGLMGIMMWAIEENIRTAFMLEVLYLVWNIIEWIIVFGYYEQVCPCLIAPGEEEEGKEECEGENCDEEGGGAGSADDEIAPEYYPQNQFMMPPGGGGYGQPMNRAMQQQMFQQSMQGPNMMGSVLPAPGMGYQGQNYGPGRAGSRHSLQAMPIQPGYSHKQLHGRRAGSRHSVHGMPRAQGQIGGSNRWQRSEFADYPSQQRMYPADDYSPMT